MNAERNILFAVEALRMELLDTAQLIDACQDWAGRKATSMSDVLAERRWLTAPQRESVHAALEDHLAHHGGDVRAALGATAGIEVRDSIRIVQDAEVQATLNELPPPSRRVRLEGDDEAAADVSRYTLTRQYSEGGLGRIWLATDGDLHRDVILKELHPDRPRSEGARRRFLREAKVTGQLEHPNIVPVYELGRWGDDGRPYYTMRYVRGQTLRDAIAAHYRRRRRGGGSLEQRRLLTVFASIGNAIAYAHSRGVIHRDLKPENVVVGGFGEVILLDWGLAKLVDQVEREAVGLEPVIGGDPLMTAVGGVMGTPAYMSPEQAQGRADLDERTDVYGLGAILFEILTGRPPHQGDDAAEVLRGIARNPSSRPRDVQPSVPAALDAICAKAMAKDREHRYATAIEVVDDVQRWLADEPVSAFREPVLQRAVRWTRRHRTAAVAALVVLFSLAISLVNSSWQHNDAIDAELETLGQETSESTGRLLQLIDGLRDDAAKIAQDPRISDLLGAAANLADGRLAEEFRTVLRFKPHVFQIRVLDATGQERVRVQRDPGAADDEPEIVRGVLPNNGDREYFTEAIGLSAGEIYLSRVELNKEGGQVVEPHVPVIRASAPVRGPANDASGRADGLVVINVEFEPLFEMLEQALKERQSLYVSDHEGWLLSNADDDDATFGFDLGIGDDAKEYRIHGIYPALVDEDDPFNASVTSDSTHGRRAVGIRRVDLTAERFLCVAIAEPEQDLLARARSPYGWITIVAMALALILIVALAIAFSRDGDGRRRVAKAGQRLVVGAFGRALGHGRSGRAAKRRAE